jgi:diguanylate cyclase (GGDEF)-like protein
VDDSGEPLGADRCPLALTLADGVPREANIHLRHRDGHRVPVCLRPVALRDEHGEISGGLSSLVETFTPAGEARLAGAPEGIDSVDALTGVGGRRATELRLGESVGELRRYGWPFGVVVLDVGDLARVNHTYGRQAGDRVLRTVARALNASSRPFDVVGRWSGDEFLVLVKNVDEDQLERVADRLRSLVSSTVVPLDPAPIRVTASTGTASAEPQDTPVSLAARARLGRPRTADAGTPSS